MKEIITEKYARSMTGVDLVAWRPGYNFKRLVVDVVSPNKRERERARVNLLSYLKNINKE